MKTNSESVLNVFAVGAALAVLLFQNAASVRGDTEGTQQANITGTWEFSIRYTGGEDRSTDAPKRVSGPAKGNDVSLGAPATNNVGPWITARFTSFRVANPAPGNL